MAGEEDGIGAEGKLSMEQLLTDQKEAYRFVDATGVDALAIAVERAMVRISLAGLNWRYPCYKQNKGNP